MDILKNNYKNAPTMYYQRREWIEWSATTFYYFQHLFHFQQKCSSGYMIIDNIQGYNSSLIIYVYLLIYAHVSSE